MSQLFDEETGSLTPVTVIQAGPCPVVCVRTQEADGYDAVQLAFDEVAERKLTKPELGHLKKHGLGPHRRLVEIRGAHELSAGDTVTVEGFQGTVKRHRFSRGPVTHGSHNVRAPGSVGASAYPSRVFKGMRMAGHMGAHKVTQRGLTLVDRDAERNILLIRGAVPGPRNAIVVIREDS
jgi:large subunit ribosomal protein L3